MRPEVTCLWAGKYSACSRDGYGSRENGAGTFGYDEVKREIKILIEN